MSGTFTPSRFKRTRGKLTRPRRALIYGPHGIGKSTCAKNSLLVDIEGGSGDIEVANRIDLSRQQVFATLDADGNEIEAGGTTRPTNYQDIIDCIGSLFDDEIAEPTIAIDTVDWVDRIIEAEVCRANNVKALADIEYGKGPGKKLPYWSYILAGLDKLRLVKGKNILLLAHAQLEKVTKPDVPVFQRYAPKLDNPASSYIQEWCDEVLAYRYRVVTSTEKLGFGQTRQLAVNTTERFIQTAETPSALAKNRLSLDLELASFAQYEAFLAK